MIGAQCELFDGSTRAEIDSGEAVAHFSAAVSTVGRIAQPKLPVGVGAPAFDQIVVEQGARVP